MSGDPTEHLSRAELRNWLHDAALNWLAHDGLWFRAVEDHCGLETAIALDQKAWEAFTVIEAKRIMKRLSLQPGGGIPALIRCLAHRLYALINVQEVSEADDRRCVFRMKNCRVQEARRKQGLADFPCREVGLVEYAGFARTIDSRLETRCLYCPPEAHPPDAWCAWEFVLKEDGDRTEKSTAKSASSSMS